MGAQIGDEFRPGQKVPRSGIYRVVHDKAHAEPHDVTCVFGEPFPPCHGCGSGVRLLLTSPAFRVFWIKQA